MLRAPTGSGDARFVANGDILLDEFEELRPLEVARAPLAVEAKADSDAEEGANAHVKGRHSRGS